MDTNDMSSMTRDKKRWFGKDRKTSLGQTNLNNRYFMRLIKKETDEFLSTHGDQIKRKQPEIYYSMKNKPLPKQYQKEEVVKPVEVKPSVPNPVRENELGDYLKRRDMERKAEAQTIRNAQKSEVKPFFRVERKDPNRGMRFVSAYGPINTGRFGHSQSWKYKKEKKRSYYW